MNYSFDDSHHVPNKEKIPIHVVAKPIGPICNLKCDYCFYLEKKALYDSKEKFLMNDDVLEGFIKSYIGSQAGNVVEFVWQGGEPTLMGIDFYKKVVSLQKSFSGDKKIKNSIQTNGTLLNEVWCKFLKSENFMVGISLDGPKEIHNRNRHNQKGEGTFDEVMKGLRLLKNFGIDYNVLACVTQDTAQKSLEVYRFFKENGVEFIQFTPVVERIIENEEANLKLIGPADLTKSDNRGFVTEWSVNPEDYGNFLIEIFEEWVRQDVGSTFVMNFEWALNAWLGNPSPICIHAETCGQSVVIEHNGDIFACDHTVFPDYLIGNILKDDLQDMVKNSLESGFGISKMSKLPRTCLECKVLRACQGGCPNTRFSLGDYGEPGMQYLCAGYKKFFMHISKYLRAMATLIEHNLPVSNIMDAVRSPIYIKDGKVF